MGRTKKKHRSKNTDDLTLNWKLIIALGETLFKSKETLKEANQVLISQKMFPQLNLLAITLVSQNQLGK